MKRYLYFMLVAALFAASCTKENQEETLIKAPAIIASQESEQNTKTLLAVDEGVGTIYWQPAEDINVFYGTTSAKYTSTNTENVTVASFETSTIIGSSEGASTNIWGLYPYSSDAVCDGSKVTTTIPATQYAVAETFDKDLFTTLAHSATKELQFFNVCGGIKFSLSRADITKITFKGNNDETLAGKVDLTFSDDLPVATSVTAESTITLTPKTGTTFAQGVNYYIITLPVSMSSGFTMTFETETQIGTFNYTTKTVSVSRSKFGKKADIDIYATFTDKPSAATDLSASGTANCYIVSTAGTYKFKTVQGNSSTSVGDIKGVKVLWETFGTNVAPSVGDLIKADLSYADNYITFSTNDTYQKGNAVIAAYSDANCTDGNVLWSWHIWLTDQPEEQVYNNNAGTMMDRNLGATSATPGDVHTLGLLFQWGRKDPFLASSSISSNSLAASSIIWPSSVISDVNYGTISYSIAHPTTFITSKNKNFDWYYTDTYSSDNFRWTTSDSPKGLYDPCPDGWRIPDGGSNGIWAKALGYQSNHGDFAWDSLNKGTNFGSGNGKAINKQLGADNNIWYPSTGRICAGTNTIGESGYNGGQLYHSGNSGYYWSCTLDNDAQHYHLYFNHECYASYGGNDYNACGHSIRCQKIE